MRKTLVRATHLTLAWVVLAGACSGRGDAGDGAGERTEERSDDGASTGSSARTLTLGQAPIAVAVPAPPTFELRIAHAGEYRVDVVGASVDPKMFLYLGDDLVEENDDGGDGVNARIVRFLSPGTYGVRVAEHRGRPFEAQVSAERLDPLASAGTLALGTPLAIAFPELPLMSR